MQEVTSKNTSINKDKVPKLFTTVSKKIGWVKGTTNLDVGGGKFDTATKFLAKEGVMNYVYDPYNREVEDNQRVLENLKLMGADSVTISNVLNVIDDKDAIRDCLRLAKDYLRRGGVCYITCYDSGKKGVSKKDCFQQGEPLEFYVPLVIQVFGNVEKKYGLLIARN